VLNVHAVSRAGTALAAADDPDPTPASIPPATHQPGERQDCPPGARRSSNSNIGRSVAGVWTGIDFPQQSLATTDVPSFGPPDLGPPQLTVRSRRRQRQPGLPRPAGWARARFFQTPSIATRSTDAMVRQLENESWPITSRYQWRFRPDRCRPGRPG